MNIPAEAIELGDHNRAFATPRLRGGCGELRLAIESINALSGLDLLELADNLETVRSDEAGPGLPAPLSDPARRSMPGNRQ